MELSIAIEQRYSERSYSERKPSREDIQKVLRAAWHAPNSCNMQVMHFIVIDDEEVRLHMAKMATNKFLWAPVNIILMIDSRITTKRHSGIMSLGAAMQNMSLMATDLGLATCPMAGFSGDDKIKEFLKIPKHFDLVLVLGIGYPSKPENKRLRERIPLVESVHWNAFDDTGFRNTDVDVKKWTVSELINYRRRIAPVYRYNGRFGLDTYSSVLYDRVVMKLQETLGVGFESVLDVLDVNTYGGNFLKALLLVLPKNSSVTVTDHLDYILENTSDFGRRVNVVKIDENSKIQTKNQYDLATCVHRLQFCPDWNAMLLSAIQVVKAEGHFLVVIDDQSKIGWKLRELFLKCKAFFKKELFNVYENNPYYKFGPYSPIDSKRIRKIMKIHGFELIYHDNISGGSISRSNRSIYEIYKRAN